VVPGTARAQSDPFNILNEVTAVDILNGAKWCWRAVYSGDENYTAANTNLSFTNTSTECFNTPPITFQNSTQSSRRGVIDDTVTQATDTFSIQVFGNGAPNPVAPNHEFNVTFFICHDNGFIDDSGGAPNGDVENACASGGSQVGAVKQTTGGNPGTATSDTYNIPGSSAADREEWCWRAEFSGTGFYAGITGQHTNSLTECFERVPVGGTAIIIVIDEQ
jgi:hypothetical protein